MRLLAFLCSLILSVSPYLPDDDSNILADIGLEASVLSQKQSDKLIDSFQIVRTTERFDTGGIQSLAMNVTDPEYFYVGFDDPITNGTYIECFSIEERFQYTIQFYQEGSYEIFCIDNRLFLYIVRGDFLFSFDHKGNVNEVYNMHMNSYLDSNVLDQLSKQTQYVVDGKTFEIGTNSSIQHPFFAPYSYLKVTDHDGTSHYLCKTSESPSWAMVGIMILWVIMTILTIKNQYESKKDNDRTNDGIQSL